MRLIRRLLCRLNLHWGEWKADVEASAIVEECSGCGMELDRWQVPPGWSGR